MRHGQIIISVHQFFKKQEKNKMGFDCDAVTVIGLRVPLSRVQKRTETVTKLNHEQCPTLNAKAHKFCPDCGRSTVLVDEQVETLQRVGKYEIYHPSSGVYGALDRANFVYICMRKSVRQGPRNFDEKANAVIVPTLEELAAEREVMRARLTPLGFWTSDHEFGIYTLISFGN